MVYSFAGTQVYFGPGGFVRVLPTSKERMRFWGW